MKKLWELFVALVGLILAMEATSVWPKLYYPGVILVYLGLVAAIVDSIQGKFVKQRWLRWLFAVSLSLCLVYWTAAFVFANADLRLSAQPAMGNYVAGSTIAGIKWQKNFEEIRVQMDNPTEYDFRDINLIISSDLIIQQVGQFESACEGFNEFSGVTGAALLTAGKELIQPVAPTVSTKRHIRCSALASHSAASLVIGKRLVKGVALRPKRWYGPGFRLGWGK
jgi:hypothetical protein